MSDDAHMKRTGTFTDMEYAPGQKSSRKKCINYSRPIFSILAKYLIYKDREKIQSEMPE